MIKRLTKHVIVRYGISGGTSATTQLIVLFVLNSLLRVHYLLASTIAFLCAFSVSFTLHKFWTFKNDGSVDEIIHKQAFLYFVVCLCGLGLNNLLLYLFVHYMQWVVIYAQVLVIFMVASCTYFISRNFVFKYKKENLA